MPSPAHPRHPPAGPAAGRAAPTVPLPPGRPAVPPPWRGPRRPGRGRRPPAARRPSCGPSHPRTFLRRPGEGGTPFGESILKFKTSKTFLVLRAASRRNPPPQGGTHSRPPSSLAGAQRIRPPCLLLGGPTFKQSLVVSATLWNSPGVRPGAGPLREGPQAP